MKLINAFWDERNLGLKSCEVVFEKGEILNRDQIEDIKNKFQYIVVKIPEGDIQIVHELEEDGFRYLENKFHYSADPGDVIEFNKNYLTHYSDIVCKITNETANYDLIKSNISDHLFEYDRISLDPYFNANISSLRHKLWVEDLFKKKDVETYILKKSDKIFGFFIFEKKEHCCFIPLAGIFEEYQKTGLAFFLIYFPFKVALENGSKSVEAVFSSNNVSIVNLIARITKFRITQSYIVLRRISQ